jgi:hypothetical protein
VETNNQLDRTVLMTIERRGDGILILKNSGVLVFEIAEKIVSGKNMQWLCERYPITPDDVFDVIDQTADSLNDWHDAIKLENVGDNQSINLQTVKVNDTLFFNLLSFGHSHEHTITDFNELYIVGLERVVYDIYSDIKDSHYGYEDSDLHLVVYDALLDAIGDVDPDQVLALLEKKNND